MTKSCYAHATLLLTTLLRSANGQTGNTEQPVDRLFYPDWASGSKTCINKNTTAPTSYLFIVSTGYLMPTLESCCEKYFSRDILLDCMLQTGESAPVIDCFNSYVPGASYSDGDQVSTTTDCTIDVECTVGDTGCGSDGLSPVTVKFSSNYRCNVGSSAICSQDDDEFNPEVSCDRSYILNSAWKELAPCGLTDDIVPALSPTPAPWSIEFDNMSSNFGFPPSSTNEALVLMYNIGKGRDHDSFFYAGLCLGNKSMVDPPGVITKNEDQIYDSATPAMSALKLSYGFNMSMISSSNIWNNITKKLELCHVTRLMHKREEPEEDLVIVESFYNLTIFFDLLKNFTVGIGLDEATINEVNDTADISSYVDAYYCDGSDAMNKLVDDAELAPNEDLSVCFMSESTDIEIAEITSMVIKGVDDKEQNSQLTVMADGKASIPSITSFRFVNTTHTICTTRVPINMFDYERDDATITIEGTLTTNLQDSIPARKLMSTSGADNKGRILQEAVDNVDQEALFGFSVNLKPGESAEEEETFMLKSDAEALVGLKGIFFICKLFATAYVFW